MDVTNNLTEEEIAMLEQALEEVHNSSIIPQNSNTFLIDESTSRFSSALWFDEIRKKTVTLAGLGGIGSWCALLLSRVKVSRMIIWDDDVVETTNLSGQLYNANQVDMKKVVATNMNMINFSNFYSAVQIPERFSLGSEATDIMICGFDNMTARGNFFTAWMGRVLSLSEEDRKNCLYIDGRLSAEEFQVFCIKGTDDFLMKKYSKEWLFNDSEAEETLCSYKQTSFCANMIASVMVNLFVNFVANLCDPVVERELPFLTTYDAERMHFKKYDV